MSGVVWCRHLHCRGERRGVIEDSGALLKPVESQMWAFGSSAKPSTHSLPGEESADISRGQAPGIITQHGQSRSFAGPDIPQEVSLCVGNKKSPLVEFSQSWDRVNAA